MTSGGKLTISAGATSDDIRLEIADTGPGLPPGKDIFEPFFTTKTDDTGLGLTVVRQIISAHGGTVTYENLPGKGTTFYLSLPRNQAKLGELTT